jgi:uncharacterized protein (DUF2267 family)
MSSSGLDVFDATVQQTNVWLNEIVEELHREDRHAAYLAMRAVLHALRDNLPIDESADLAAQLPMLVRGLYYEGWKPSQVPVRDRSRAAFLERVERSMARAQPDFPAEHAVRAVLRVLGTHVSAGELDDVKNALTKDIREFWD